MADDLAALPTLDAAAIVECLRARFDAGRIYTMCGDLCISVNPYEWSTERATHLHHVVDQARGRMRERAQTLVVTGESGAGKTEVTKLALAHLADDRALDLRGVLETSPLLEFLGNAQTRRNGNSSRFGKYLVLAGETRLAGRIETYLLERSRAAAVPADEGSFRLFYAVLDDPTLRDRHATHAFDRSHLGLPQAAVASEWTTFANAARSVGLDDATLERVAAGAVGVLCLGARDYASAASAVGVVPAEVAATLGARRTRVGAEEIWSECTAAETRARARALAMDLYRRLFDEVVARANRALGAEGAPRFGVLDIFGFERFEHNGFEQLCINYCNEQLQQLFVKDVLVMRQLEYANEGVDWSPIATDDNARVVAALDRAFGLIDETARVAVADLADQLVRHGAPHLAAPRVRAHDALFLVHHYAGEVVYDAALFAERNLDDLRPELVELMATSHFADLYDLAASPRRRSIASTLRAQTTALVDHLLSNELRYVRCLKSNGDHLAHVFDPPLVRDQVVVSGLVHACAVLRAGFAERATHAALRRQFPRTASRRLVEEIAGFWGRTTAFLPTGGLAQLRRHEAAALVGAAARAFVRHRRARALRRAAAARTLQRRVRDFHNRETTRYAQQSEVERLRACVATLTRALQERDAWIFRAKQALAAK